MELASSMGTDGERADPRDRGSDQRFRGFLKSKARVELRAAAIQFHHSWFTAENLPKSQSFKVLKTRRHPYLNRD